MSSHDHLNFFYSTSRLSANLLESKITNLAQNSLDNTDNENTQNIKAKKEASNTKTGKENNVNNIDNIASTEAENNQEPDKEHVEEQKLSQTLSSGFGSSEMLAYRHDVAEYPDIENFSPDLELLVPISLLDNSFIPPINTTAIALNEQSLQIPNNVIIGTRFPDTLIGTEDNDSIFGLGESDLIYGGLGNDLIKGAAGDDELYGDDGDDQLTGSEGEDKLYGGNGNDILQGGIDDDFLEGNSGEDFIRGGEGNDELRGGADNDMLIGNGGNDIIYGGDGDDIIQGKAGDDIFFGVKGSDIYTGGAGRDTFNFSLNANREGDIEVITDYSQSKGELILFWHTSPRAIRLDDIIESDNDIVNVDNDVSVQLTLNDGISKTTLILEGLGPNIDTIAELDAAINIDFI